MPRHAFVINATDFNFWHITLLSYNLAKLLGFLVFSYLEEAYISPSCFVTEETIQASVFGRIIVVSFYFCK